MHVRKAKVCEQQYLSMNSQVQQFSLLSQYLSVSSSGKDCLQFLKCYMKCLILKFQTGWKYQFWEMGYYKERKTYLFIRIV